MPRKKVVIKVKLPEELITELERLAKAKRKPVNLVVEEAIRRLLKEEKRLNRSGWAGYPTRVKP